MAKVNMCYLASLKHSIYVRHLTRSRILARRKGCAKSIARPWYSTCTITLQTQQQNPGDVFDQEAVHVMAEKALTFRPSGGTLQLSWLH